MQTAQHGRRGVLLVFLLGVIAIGPLACGGNNGGRPPVMVATTQQQSNPKQDAAGTQPVLAINTTSPRDREAEETDVAAIEKLEGRVLWEEPDRTMVKVDLGRPKVTDADLVHLKLFSSLRELDLHAPQITDAGLQHLQGLTKLRILNLNFTSVTGPGL